MKKILLLIPLLCLCQIGVTQTLKRIGVLERKNDTLFIAEGGRRFRVKQEVVTVKFKKEPVSMSANKNKIRSNRLGFADLAVPTGIDIESYVSLLEKSRNFEVVEYNSIGEYCLTTNDTEINRQWYLGTINLFNAWDFTMGNSNTTVAILDSGTDWRHPDIGNGTDGYKSINEALAWNYISNTNNVITSNEHGTRVAGIVGAKSNNSRGIAGVSGGNHNRGITMIPFCVGIDAPDGSIIDDAIIDAVDLGVRIIQLSLSIVETNAINAAIEYAHQNNVVVICASGNNNPISTITYPASHQRVIAVGGTAQNNKRASFAKYGQNLDVVAPAVDIYSTALNNGYNSQDGTSFAAPQVAGVAALILSVRPDLTGQQVRNIIEQTAQKVGGYSYANTPGRPNGTWHQEMGYGLVDAHAALQAVAPRISGPSTVCDQATYTIENLLAGATVQWNSSGNLPRVSAQGAHPCTFAANPPGTSGDGWIEAVLIYQSDSINIPRKILHVGTESPTIHGTEFPAVWRHAVYTVDSPVAEWVITPAEGVITRTKGNKMDAIFRKTGEYRIGARTDNGCGYGPFAYRTANVSDIDSIFGNPEISYYSSAISGPSEICDNVAFSINVPPGATIKWFCEGKVRQVSPQGDNPCVFSAHPSGTSGEGLIGAVVFIQDTPYRVREKNVTIGTPGNISMTGNMFPANYEWVTYTALTDNMNLTWDVIPSNGVSMTPYGNQLNVMFTSGGTYQLGVKASNSCGYGTYAYQTILVTDSIFRIYPNPAKDMVTVELGISGGKPQQGKQESAGVCEIQLWSAAALIRRYETDQHSYQLSVSGLPAGVYFIRVIRNGKTQTKKLLKK